MNQKCEKCEGKGKISFFRSDIEDFDEMLCPECNGKGILLEDDQENI